MRLVRALAARFSTSPALIFAFLEVGAKLLRQPLRTRVGFCRVSHLPFGWPSPPPSVIFTVCFPFHAHRSKRRPILIKQSTVRISRKLLIPLPLLSLTAADIPALRMLDFEFTAVSYKKKC